MSYHFRSGQIKTGQRQEIITIQFGHLQKKIEMINRARVSFNYFNSLINSTSKRVHNTLAKDVNIIQRDIVWVEQDCIVSLDLYV